MLLRTVTTLRAIGVLTFLAASAVGAYERHDPASPLLMLVVDSVFCAVSYSPPQSPS